MSQNVKCQTAAKYEKDDLWCFVKNFIIFVADLQCYWFVGKKKKKSETFF